MLSFFFFFNDTATTEIYTLSLHDALPIFMEAIVLHKEVNKVEARERAIDMLARVGMPRPRQTVDAYPHQISGGQRQRAMIAMALDRKSTRLNSSHANSSYAVFCLKKQLNSRQP